MKFFKKCLLLCGLLPSLVACNTSSIAGTYSFQMGKETGTHFGVALNLTDRAYVPEEGENLGDEKFKDFTFTVSAKMSRGEEIKSILDMINKYFPKGLPGYYRLTNEKNKKQESRIKLGFSFSKILEIILKAIAEESEEEIPIPSTEELNELNESFLIHSLLYATYKSDVVNFYIPVSLDDVYFQLYWYGRDVKISASEFDFEIVNVTEHPVGTSPTPEEVEEINKTFIEEHKDCVIKEYRVFNQVKLGLTKE